MSSHFTYYAHTLLSVYMVLYTECLYTEDKERQVSAPKGYNLDTETKEIMEGKSRGNNFSFMTLSLL